MDVEIIGREIVYSGKKVVLEKLFLRIRGNTTFHEIVRFGQSVAVLPFIDDHNVILVRQFRGPIEGWILEVPAGRVDEGEEPDEACLRELEEETGYRASKLEKLASVYLSPGYSDEMIHLYVARELEYVGQHLEEHEALNVVTIRYNELIDMVHGGEIMDAKTALLVLLYEARRRSGG